MNIENRDVPRMNDEITAQTIRLIDEHGEMRGVMSLKEAKGFAYIANLDLIEINEQDGIPVCRIVDYGKYRYEKQKKEKEFRKKNKPVVVKELIFRPTIDDNDYNLKIKHAKEFLAAGNKVKFTMKFKGREISHQDIGNKIVERIQTDLESVAKVELSPSLEGKQIILILAPR